MVCARGKTVALSLFAATALSVCGASAAKFVTVPPGDELIAVAYAELSKAKRINKKREDSASREEYALFIGDDMHAVFVLLAVKNEDYAVDNDFSVENIVDHFEFNKTHKKKWGQSIRVPAMLGTFSVKQYTLPEANQECIGFSVESESNPEDIQSRPLKLLLGYYCATADGRLSAANITRLVKGIYVK